MATRAGPATSLSSPAPESDAWLHRYTAVLAVARGDEWVLDLGCGYGHDLRELRATGLRVVGADLSRDRLAVARRLNPSSGLLLADMAGGLPFRGGVFGLVVASLSLHYFPSATTDRVVADIARVLADGGRLLARVNAVGDVNFGYGQGQEIEPDVFRLPDGQVKRFFTPETLRATLAPYFDIEGIAPRTIRQRGREKRVLEGLARRRRNGGRR